jgi:uncharacterized membrane protein
MFNFVRILFNFKSIKLCCYQLWADVNPQAKTNKRQAQASRRDNMKINNFNAVGIAEGFIECDDEEKIIEAWQYLIDTGLAFKLQGWFGRTAIDLIEQGICKKQQASEQKG